ncbi:hypothetical protein NEUTE1DRAFT_107755 [Neurospora tetrasperma FGSC 2508]|uniref:Uncharacterized protein n=1 Tax=Neurospora tetrasperma (strain FGSC 2508 / ATCC MYA-4615 / P0657) TaxID=510951 RepID=F8MC77_NEUT8|nr:uncharacterized protein NEUTE1DRAFT_107755 [Neurospora tetrasperma FGSC 2508]EGO61232.1 hypothetical protein NEUTE1DRAFT_107755 [Neurospora tetrasperma FGSC 2508]EGZ74763.1 hypothetical protein NEUTE2DRAFT_136014 [Neurospora tetrasperma FGSC 2509]
MLVHRQKVWGKSADRKQVEREAKTRRLGMGPEGKREEVCQEEQPANKGRARSEGREEERKQEQSVSSHSTYGESVNGSGSVGFGGLAHQSLADMATEGSPHIHGVCKRAVLPPFSVLARRNKGELMFHGPVATSRLDDIIRLIKVTSHGS